MDAYSVLFHVSSLESTDMLEEQTKQELLQPSTIEAKLQKYKQQLTHFHLNMSLNSFLPHHHYVFPTFHKMGPFTRILNGVAALLGRGPLCTCCSLLQNPRSWGRYVWAPNRWSRRGGLNMRNWRLWVYGWEVNEETWFFGSMLILLEMTFFRWYFGDHIFFLGGVIFLRLLYCIRFGVICFWLVFGVIFVHLSLGSTLPPPTQLGFVSLFFWSSFCLRSF